MVQTKIVDDIICVQIEGELVGHDVEEAITQVQAASDQLRQQGQKVNILVNISGVKSENSQARLEIINFLKLNYDKLALYGASEDISRVVLYLIPTAADIKTAKYFNTEREARNWLKDRKPKLTRSKFWQALALLTSLALLAGIIWVMQLSFTQLDQKRAKARQDYVHTLTTKINDRIATYVDHQYGFEALFDASSKVTGDEFDTYFNTTQLAQRYPGVSAITMIRYVRADQLPAYLKEAASDPLYKRRGINYTVQKSDQAYYLPVAFIEPLPTNNSAYGLDLSISPERRDNLLNALQTGQPSYSKAFNLNGLVNPGTQRLGFIVSLPIFKGAHGTAAERQQNIYGFVNTVFAYQEIFDALLKNEPTDGLYVNLTSNGQTVYTLGSKSKSQVASGSEDLILGSQKISVDVRYPKNFGLAKGEDGGPAFLLIIGLIIWGLLNILYVVNARKRSSTVRLAQKINQDLETEKANAETQRNRTEAILSSIGDGVFAIDTNRNVILFNPAAAKVSGFSPEDVMGKPYDEVLVFKHEETGKKNDDFITAALNGQITKMSNHTILARKDGSSLPVADSASPIMVQGDIIVGVIVVFRDASEERELDRRAKIISEAKAKDDALLSAIGEGLIAFDTTGHISRVNAAAEKMLGYKESELLGSKFSETLKAVRFDGSKIADDERPAMKAQDTGETINDSFNYLTKTGTELPVRVSVAPVRLDHQSFGAIELFQDITSERELDKAKDDFVGLVSHQLSTPATAVKANLGMIIEGFATKKSEIDDAIQEAYDSNERQIQIVQDMLNVARIENRRLVVTNEKLDVGKAVEKIIHDLKIDLANRKHTAKLQIDGKLEISADPKLFSFVVGNLISNASKYSDQTDPIIVKVELEADSVLIHVIDHGVGISKADQAKLFHRFSRVDNPLSTLVGGSGLGLYIAKQMAELMEGDISVQSEVGKGTTFTVKLPRGEVHDKSSTS